ncbi:MAG: hypothetical protein ACI8WB_004722, partial [Phenylobacterium sp.]
EKQPGCNETPIASTIGESNYSYQKSTKTH